MIKILMSMMVFMLMTMLTRMMSISMHDDIYVHDEGNVYYNVDNDVNVEDYAAV